MVRRPTMNITNAELSFLLETFAVIQSHTGGSDEWAYLKFDEEGISLDRDYQGIRNSPAIKHLSLPIPRDHSLYQSLELLRSDPEDKRYVTAVLMPPVVIYYFNDGNYSISYGLSLLTNGDRLVSIYNIREC